MYFQLLGPLEVSDHERSVPIGGGKRRSLLALLLLHANEVVSAERLIDELWGERPPATSAKSVQVYVSQLRRELRGQSPNGELLVTRSNGYLLRLGRDDLDVQRFERTLAEGERALAAGEAGRGARALARAAAGRLHLRAVRPAGDRAARRAAPGGAGAAHRGRARPRPARTGRRGP
jgi:DNA-binding SARP family transcriptional activator